MRHRLCAFAAVLVSAAVAGCSGSEPGAGAWEAEYAWALEMATSDFERSVLADGEITRAEYEEATQRFLDCVNDQGASVATLDQGGYFIYEISGDLDLYDEISDECRIGTNDLIETLYVDQITNPDNVDFEELTVDCLVRAGLVEEGFTVAEFHEGLGGVIADSSGQQSSSPWQLPFEPEDPLFDFCMVNPAREIP